MIFSRRPAAPTVARRHLALRVEQLDIAEGLPLPAYQSDGAAGLDLIAAVPTNKPMRLKPGARGLVPTGLRLALPRGTEAQVRPRSGLALKHGVTVLNSPGTIDCDYRGEVQVLLVNLGTATFVVNRGERIAQLVIAPVARAELSMATLDGTARGAGGFGSTGQAILSDPNGSAGNGTTTMGVVETSKRKRSDDMARTAAGKKRVGRKAGARKSAARKVTKVAAKKTTRAATKKATRAPARRASAKSARVGARKTARGAASGRRTAAATTRVASRTTAAKRGRTAATKTARKSARKVGAKSVRKAATRRPARGRPTGVRTAARKKSNGLRGRRRS